MEVLTDKQLAAKLISLRKATEDYETAKELLRDSEHLIKTIRADLKPYTRLFENTIGHGPPTTRQRKSPTIRHARIASVDYPGVAKTVERAGGHCSVQQFMRLEGATASAASARLHGARNRGLLTVTQIGRKVIFHTPGKEPMNHGSEQ